MQNRLIDLPPLDLLRTFVAVGRRMSISLASQDLCIVQSAVSRQVQALEKALGCRLFVRSHRSIEFTPEGRHLFRSADSMLEQFGSVISTLRPAGRPCVTITATIGVTSLWLLPRLGAFQRSVPGIDVRVAATNRLVDLDRDGIDLALRYCPDLPTPEGGTRLFGETLVPVAHPSLGVTAIERPAQLRENVLLDYDDSSRPWLQWKSWLHEAGLQKDSSARQARMLFNQYDQVVQAALAGQGVALGRMALIKGLLAEGKLVRASARAEVQSDYGYWLVVRRNASSAAVRTVQDWILAQAVSG